MTKLFLLLCPALLLSQAVPFAQAPHTVRAVGEATVKRAPDQAQIDVGVSTRASTADHAVAQSAGKTTSVLTALKSIVTRTADIQTASYSVQPEYKYEQGQSPEITGYVASQTVHVILNDVKLVGKVIDACSKAGANSFNQITFGLKDDSSARMEAIAKATATARGNAEAMAKALGVSVTGVAWAETTESETARPIQPLMRMQPMAAVATPIESGALEVHASVTVALQVR